MCVLDFGNLDRQNVDPRDTVDYMKELLERIRRLQEEMEEACPHQHPGPAAAAAAPLLSVFRELNPNEMLARNTPKVSNLLVPGRPPAALANGAERHC